MKKIISKSNKILGLEKMKNLGFSVPKFDFIPDYTELGLQDKDINLSYPPDILVVTIKSKLKNFDMNTGISLRSASFDEDNSNQSSAGRYLSFNGLININEVIEAAVTIWKHHRQNSNNVKCPLIIQETHPSFYSGVAFKDGDTIIIESYYGACSNIVDGSIRPFITTFKNGKRTDNFSENNKCSNYSYLYSVHKNVFKNKNFGYGKLVQPRLKNFTTNNHVYNTVNSKIVRVYGIRPDCPIDCYDNKIIPQVLNILSELDNKNGVDIEWGSDIEGKVYVYQFRQLTRKISNLNIAPQISTTNNQKTFQGIPVSSGKITGMLQDDVSKLDENSILLLEFDNVDDVNYLKNIKGVVSIYGGILSHLSIICRELNIPCIVGVNNNLPSGKTVEIDGNTGTINILD